VSRSPISNPLGPPLSPPYSRVHKEPTGHPLPSSPGLRLLLFSSSFLLPPRLLASRPFSRERSHPFSPFARIIFSRCLLFLSGRPAPFPLPAPPFVFILFPDIRSLDFFFQISFQARPSPMLFLSFLLSSLPRNLLPTPRTREGLAEKEFALFPRSKSHCAASSF